VLAAERGRSASGRIAYSRELDGPTVSVWARASDCKTMKLVAPDTIRNV